MRKAAFRVVFFWDRGRRLEIGPLTELLQAWAQGDRSSEESLFRLVYPELQRLALQRLRHERAEISVQVDDLVNETYLKFVEQRALDWTCRSQFFALAAMLMRRILVDRAKHRGRLKRGGGAIHISLGQTQLESAPANVHLLELDAALNELAKIKLHAARIVELRYFAGLSLEETASALDIGRTSVVRHWRFARAWLAQRLEGA